MHHRFAHQWNGTGTYFDLTPLIPSRWTYWLLRVRCVYEQQDKQSKTRLTFFYLHAAGEAAQSPTHKPHGYVPTRFIIRVLSPSVPGREDYPMCFTSPWRNVYLTKSCSLESSTCTDCNAFSLLILLMVDRFSGELQPIPPLMLAAL